MVSFGRNDFVLPLLFQPTRVGLHRDLEIGLVPVAVDPERRVEVGVTERLGRCVDSGHAPELGREGVASEVHVQPVRDPAADETGRFELAVPPAMDSLSAGALLRVGPDGALLLAFRAASVVDLLGRVEEVVVRLGRPADVGEIAAEEEPKLGENRPAER
jgi:hypothetical protein